jgi:hypothetical protein
MGKNLYEDKKPDELLGLYASAVENAAKIKLNITDKTTLNAEEIRLELLRRLEAGQTQGVDIILAKIDWEKFLARRLKERRIFKEEELHHAFGDDPQEYIVRVIVRQK